MTYIDVDNRHPIRDTAHALRVGQALEVARRELNLHAITAVTGPAGEATCAFVVSGLHFGDWTIVVH